MMKILVLFAFCLITAGSDAVTTVTGYRGRSVQIKCHYESKYKKNKKYLCRGKCPYRPVIKDIPVQSGSPAEDTRFSLSDDTTAKIFTITITDLRAEDANTYWCVVKRTVPLRDIHTKLQLLVKTDDSASSDVLQITHTTHCALTHTVNPTVHAETPSPTVNPLNKIHHQTTLTSFYDVPGIATYLLISTGAVAFTAIVIIAVYCKINCQGRVTATQSSIQTNEDYVNDHNVLALQAREKHNLPESVYQSLDPTTNQSDSLYQTLNSTNNK
ncbi:CMRF35-like molecule 8 [Silurus meridionalis]|uniref:CMRF35-like molecule 8 n=1 Tax=Silurus meridionalis TaxID=175797 RepID=UPI001EEB95B2|nr:CMRF35-like molecule 8 [Silurus meridionalis]